MPRTRTKPKECGLDDPKGVTGLKSEMAEDEKRKKKRRIEVADDDDDDNGDD